MLCVYEGRELGEIESKWGICIGIKVYESVWTLLGNRQIFLSDPSPLYSMHTLSIIEPPATVFWLILPSVGNG